MWNLQGRLLDGQISKSPVPGCPPCICSPPSPAASSFPWEPTLCRFSLHHSLWASIRLCLNSQHPLSGPDKSNFLSADLNLTPYVAPFYHLEENHNDKFDTQVTEQTMANSQSSQQSWLATDYLEVHYLWVSIRDYTTSCSSLLRNVSLLTCSSKHLKWYMDVTHMAAWPRGRPFRLLR